MRTFVTITLLLISINSLTQDKINEIKKHYYQVSEAIQKCNDTLNPCGYYSDVLELNTNNAPWRAVGTFNKKITFWYYDDPHNCELCDENEAIVLHRIEVIEYFSVYKIYSEYTFKDGKLLFYYQKGDHQDIECEHRLYFNDTTRLKYMVNNEDPGQCEELGTDISILESARHYQDIFLIHHSYVK